MKLGDAGKAQLRAEGFAFYDWGSADSGEARLVTSWQTTAEEAERMATALRLLKG